MAGTRGLSAWSLEKSEMIELFAFQPQTDRPGGPIKRGLNISGDACVCDRSNRRITTAYSTQLLPPAKQGDFFHVGTRDYGKDMAHKRTADDLPGPAASRSCLTCATGGRCLRSVGGVIAVDFALSCTLLLPPHWCFCSEYLVTPTRGTM